MFKKKKTAEKKSLVIAPSKRIELEERIMDLQERLAIANAKLEQDSFESKARRLDLFMKALCAGEPGMFDASEAIALMEHAVDCMRRLRNISHSEEIRSTMKKNNRKTIELSGKDLEIVKKGF